MRGATFTALAVGLALAMFVSRSETSLHPQAADEDEDFRRHYPYRDYDLIRRSDRADDVFDDYGHLRFGRSDD